MRHTWQLERSDARAIVEAAHQAAEQHGDTLGPARVSIAVADSGGHLLMLERRDGASVSSADTAIAKARMAALNGKATADQEQAINGDRPALLQLAGIFGQPAVAMTGGLPLLAEGDCLGAVGVSGMTPAIDLAIAEAAAAAFAVLAAASNH
ncbi:MAG: heme-binding protein [Cyanobacteria bacterium M_surface_7_m2_040]|nr:heme-binding protein [Cyanobacteria bacterium K_Offshore_0m_m2_072]MBM5809569.1 heme-binding protein [Cyanobacteria bacterium M_surface_9_m1_291]MBM5827484.1 heme-binding protein [Cyanobacteria bacterium M_surface_7_m2_040]